MPHFVGLYPRLVWFAPLVLGRGENCEWTRMNTNGGCARGTEPFFLCGSAALREIFRKTSLQAKCVFMARILTGTTPFGVGLVVGLYPG